MRPYVGTSMGQLGQVVQLRAINEVAYCQSIVTYGILQIR
jgi:hypothetical protein